MSIFTPVDNFVKKQLHSIENILESPLAHKIEKDLDEALNFALPIVETFAGTGYVPVNVVTVMQKYAIPVADGLASGSITAIDEIKTLVGDGVSYLIQKNHGFSSTVAKIINNLAYARVKPTVVVPAGAVATLPPAEK